MALSIRAALVTFAVLKPMRMLSIPNEKFAPDRVTTHSHNGLLAVFKDFRAYLFAFAVFSQYCVVNTFAYWGPTLLQDTGLTDVRIIGLYGAIPLIIGAIGMYLAAWHSDASGERLWHAIAAQILTSRTLSLPW